jgi:putative spermidine/putrescine transport system permease protein
MIILYCLTALVLVYVVAPLVIVVAVSFGSSPMMEFPPRAYSTKWYEAYFNNAEWISATMVSLRVAICVTILATILGSLAAMALRVRRPGHSLMRSLLLAPMVVPTIVVAIACYFFFVPLTKSGIPLVGSELGLIIAHTVLAIPFVFIAVSSALGGFDTVLERAAGICGANPFQTFRRITLPLIAPGILSGAVFAFVASFDEVIIALFLTGARIRTLPIKMWEGIRFEIDPTVPAVSTLLMVFSFVVLGISELLRRRADRYSIAAKETSS